MDVAAQDTMAGVSHTTPTLYQRGSSIVSSFSSFPSLYQVYIHDVLRFNSLARGTTSEVHERYTRQNSKESMERVRATMACRNTKKNLEYMKIEPVEYYVQAATATALF